MVSLQMTKSQRQRDMGNFIASILIATIVAISSRVYASPCDGVNRVLNKEHTATLAIVIANQLHVASVDVLQSFKLDGWSIIYVDTHEADEAFLFYASDPLTSKHIALWSGAAAISEEQQIKDWAIKNAPGIPMHLAHCFAWHVTKNRDL